MNYGYMLIKEGNEWVLYLQNNSPLRFKKQHEALRAIKWLRLHIKPEDVKYVA